MIKDVPDRPQKITFAEMRDAGVRGLLVYCADTAAVICQRRWLAR
jgi:hypothetical protein